MSTPATSHVDPLFVPVFGEAIELLRKVLLTKDAQPFVVAGSGTLGWDMMVNLIERDDEVLVINTGYFGDKFGEWYVVFFFGPGQADMGRVGGYYETTVVGTSIFFSCQPIGLCISSHF